MYYSPCIMLIKQRNLERNAFIQLYKPIALREPLVLKNAYVGRFCDTTKTTEIRMSGFVTGDQSKVVEPGQAKLLFFVSPSQEKDMRRDRRTIGYVQYRRLPAQYKRYDDTNHSEGLS